MMKMKKKNKHGSRKESKLLEGMLLMICCVIFFSVQVKAHVVDVSLCLTQGEKVKLHLACFVLAEKVWSGSICNFTLA